MRFGWIKRVLAALLVMMLLACDVPTVFAQSTDNNSNTETENSEEESSETSSEEEESSETSSEEEESSETSSKEEESSEASSEEESTEAASEEENGEETITEEEMTTEELLVPEGEMLMMAFAARAAYEGEVAVNINHYLYDAEKTEYTEEDMLFTPDELTVENGESIAEFVKGEDLFSVKSIMIDGVDVTENYVEGQLPLEAFSETAEVAVCYEETTGTYVNGTNMIDYVNGRADDWRSINYTGNYKEGSAYNNRIATKGAVGDYVTIKTQQGDNGSLDININDYFRNGTDDLNSSSMQDYPIVTGLVTGLSGENYQDVNFAYDEPGFFSADIKNGKKTLGGYELSFERSGVSYSLDKVLKNGEVVCSDVSSFYPLNCEPDTDREITGATYFGMRYDFSFSVGDYIGEMIYTFTGDDDVWVCLDGDVILDLGGIHSPYPLSYSVLGYAPNTVDIWEVLLGEDYTVEDKIAYAKENDSKEHTVTVLFMERGGNLSNCYMDFVMPNIEAKKPVISVVEAAELEIVKKDADTKAVIADVEFILTDAKGVNYPARTDRNGYVVFPNLSEGTYTLTETAPAGYHADGPWTVTVAKEIKDNGAKLVHYVSSVVKTETQETLSVENAVYSIENKQVELTQDKNAEVSDWNNRIYKITLETSLEEYAGNTETTGVNVIDYIDSRFLLTDEAGKPLADGTVVADALGNPGIVKKDSNGQYVEWSNLTVTTSSWMAEIYVKAKDYFIGGNMIPTNAPGSKVTAGPVTEEFDKPTVNVKLLDISLENDEITLFKGEQVTPGAYMAELSDTLSVTNIMDEKVALAGGLPTLTQEDMALLIQDKSITKTHQYLSEEMGSFVYELVDEADNDNWTDHEAKKVGKKVEDYVLKVTYTAKSLADRMEAMNGYETPEENDGEEVVSVETVVSKEENGQGRYVVNVLAGSLLIKKTINTSEADFRGGDPVFTFKVMKDGEFYSYATVRFSNTDTDTKTVAVKELGKGVYTVEECSTMRYELDSVTAGGVGNCPADAKTEEMKAVFAIGRSMDEEVTVLNKRDGEASFVNVKNNSRNFSDTDVVKNVFVIDEEGNISWSGDSLVNGGDDSLDESTQVEERPAEEAGSVQVVRGKLQSYNFQSHYVNAMADAGARMLENGNCQWKIVQGLANDGSEYVSFESVQYPGYYLRHKAYVLYLEKNDGSQLFKEDATFKMTAGLANAEWVSFESYNVSGQYVRHFDYNLRIDPITNDTGRADATFRITD